MARIATGSIVADIAGKVGDEIFSRNRQGPYVKEYVVPIQPNTSFQLTARQNFADAVTAWQNLSEAEYLAYVAFTSNFSKSSFGSPSSKYDPRSFFIANFIQKKLSLDPGIPLPIMPPPVGFKDMDVDLDNPLNPRFQANGGAFNVAYSILFFSHDAVEPSVRSINSLPMVYYASLFYLPDIPLAPTPFWTTRFSGYPITGTKRIFGKMRVIHNASGISVGEGWNSTIGVGISPPYDLGNTDIRLTLAGLLSAGATPITTIQAGTINGVTVYINAAGGNVLVGLYADSAGSPGARLAISASAPVGSSGVWRTFNFISPFVASASTNYWMAVVGSSGAPFVQSLDPITRESSITPGFNLNDPFGGTTPFVQGISHFVTVTP